MPSPKVSISSKKVFIGYLRAEQVCAALPTRCDIVWHKRITRRVTRIDKKFDEELSVSVFSGDKEINQDSSVVSLAHR